MTNNCFNYQAQNLNSVPRTNLNKQKINLNVDTGFLLVMLSIRPFANTSENESKIESKEILMISRLVSNYFHKVSKKWRIKFTRCSVN